MNRQTFTTQSTYTEMSLARTLNQGVTEFDSPETIKSLIRSKRAQSQQYHTLLILGALLNIFTPFVQTALTYKHQTEFLIDILSLKTQFFLLVPTLFTPLYGYFSDFYYPWGLRLKPYFILCCVLQVLACVGWYCLPGLDFLVLVNGVGMAYTDALMKGTTALRTKLYWDIEALELRLGVISCEGSKYARIAKEEFMRMDQGSSSEESVGRQDYIPSSSADEADQAENQKIKDFRKSKKSAKIRSRMEPRGLEMREQISLRNFGNFQVLKNFSIVVGILISFLVVNKSQSARLCFLINGLGPFTLLLYVTLMFKEQKSKTPRDTTNTLITLKNNIRELLVVPNLLKTTIFVAILSLIPKFRQTEFYILLTIASWSPPEIDLVSVLINIAVTAFFLNFINKSKKLNWRLAVVVAVVMITASHIFLMGVLNTSVIGYLGTVSCMILHKLLRISSQLLCLIVVVGKVSQSLPDKAEFFGVNAVLTLFRFMDFGSGVLGFAELRYYEVAEGYLKRFEGVVVLNFVVCVFLMFAVHMFLFPWMQWAFGDDIMEDDEEVYGPVPIGGDGGVERRDPDE